MITVRCWTVRIVTVAMLSLAASAWAQSVFTLTTPMAGDAEYSWNSKYGPYGYGAGGNSIGVGLSMGGSYGNDYTVGIIEIPLTSILSGDVLSATLYVYSNGFSTGYYYGSAAIGWLDTGLATLTGDVVADGLGPASTARPGNFTIYNSDFSGDPMDPRNGAAGWKAFDVATYLQADIAAGRTWSTFVLTGSRDTWGSLATAETGNGAYVLATSTAVPEPSTYAALAGLLALGAIVWRRRQN